MKPLRKVVIPVAGLGSRFLPATKAPRREEKLQGLPFYLCEYGEHVMHLHSGCQLWQVCELYRMREL